MAGGPPRWLLIGNSRWHWAEATAAGLRCWDEDPPQQVGWPLGPQPHAWAAVGPVPCGGLARERRLQLEEVPLGGAPAWLGIDRALAGWMAWQQSRSSVLVADAGTVLSLTLVDREGTFVGGRLMAGLALQLRAMAAGTERLPPLRRREVATSSPWPQATDEAMVQGVRMALAAAITMAAAERQAADPGCALLLTGGDAAELAPLVGTAQGLKGGMRGHGMQGQQCGPSPRLWPDLCLEALAALRPHPAAAGTAGGGFSSGPDR